MSYSVGSVDQAQVRASYPATTERQGGGFGRNVGRLPITAGEDWKTVLERAHTELSGMDFNRPEELCWTAVIVPAWMIVERWYYCGQYPTVEEVAFAVAVTVACYFAAKHLREKRFDKIHKIGEFQRVLSNPVQTDPSKVTALQNVVRSRFQRNEASLGELLTVHAEWKRALRAEAPD
jgi:hypothetical protein